MTGVLPRAVIALGGLVFGAIGCGGREPGSASDASIPMEHDTSLIQDAHVSSQDTSAPRQDVSMAAQDAHVPPLPSPSEYRMERISVNSEGVQGNAGSYDPMISSDGRFVVFLSSASNLVAGDTPDTNDIFVRDRALGTTERIGSAGQYGAPRGISRDGRFVAYINTDSHGLFVRDRSRSTTARVGSDEARGLGICGQGDSWRMALSGGENIVVLVDGMRGMGLGLNRTIVGTDPFTVCDAMGRMELAFERSGDVYVTGEHYDANVDTSITRIENTPLTRIEGRNGSARISEDGEFVVYVNNPSPGRTFTRLALGMRNCSGSCSQYIFPSPFPGASPGDLGDSSTDPCVQSVRSGSGRLDAVVAYTSLASNLIPGDTNRAADIFVTRYPSGETRRVSVGGSGREGNLGSFHSSLSGEGRWVAFDSVNGFAADDTNGVSDIFVVGVDYFFR